MEVSQSSPDHIWRATIFEPLQTMIHAKWNMNGIAKLLSASLRWVVFDNHV